VQGALAKAPEQPSYIDTLGYIYLKKKLDSSAIQAYSSLVGRYPKSPVYHYHFGMALLESGDRTKAKAEFENALANRPSHDDEVQLRALLGRAGA
jgi:predicted Zn-dependent protease